MKKTILIIVLATLCLNFRALAQSNILLTGRVTDSIGKPLPSATIKITASQLSTTTDRNGNFSMTSKVQQGILSISFVGYKSQEVQFSINEKGPFNIQLYEDYNTLNEVSVVSTGYQTIPKERATGSFVQIDSALINRKISTNILDRIDGVTSGLLFNNNGAFQYGQSEIEIRGRTTLFSNPNPLIIVDNFPYDGDPSNINPNDVQSITVLKDAAAASAWGSRSGNGVIVITTKKGRLNSGPNVSFNINTTIGAKPNLNYLPQLSSAQYIGIEQYLFNQGVYDNAISTGYQVLSPAVQIFSASRNGTLSKTDSASQINALKAIDSRNQVAKYFYRPRVEQQYQASISGGGLNQKYFVSIGYDKNINSQVGNSYDRISLNTNNTYYFLNNKLELFTNLVYTGSTSKSAPTLTTTNYPYDQLADAKGNPLFIENNLNIPYATTAGNAGLLNWLYSPLQELRSGYSNSQSDLTDYRINASLTYKIIKGLKASALYSYEKGLTDFNNLNQLQSYYTRNLINTYTQIDPISGAVTYPIPLGGILNKRSNTLSSNNGRFQIDYENSWGKNNLTAIAGTEIKNYNSFTNSYTLYGYNSETATDANQSVNFNTYYPFSYGYNSALVPANTSELGNTNRFFSIYFNGAYTYDEKYVLSASARKDESNLFGVSANQKGVPLWSAGLSWIVNKENFYNIDWLPQLKLRATYGYTGNVNTSISAYLTAINIPGASQTYNAYFTNIVNPPNPSLKWEVDRNINFGVDFVTKNNRINGSIDYWRKGGLDLIGNSPISPQTGVTTFTGNSANTLTQGVDLQINTINLNGKLKWLTTFLYNYDKNIVTEYKVSNGTNYNIVSANYMNPLAGYPYYAVFSYKYEGLTNTGDPQGFLNGKISTDYTAISNSTNRSELVYNGSATPTSFGSLRNTFIYNSFDLSFNIIYKLGYYFRRTSLNNGVLYSGGPQSYLMADYGNRWQKPGDETHTNVPALVYPDNLDRDNLYTYSNILVERADNVRLQDIRFGYTFKNVKYIHFRNLNLFTYLNNIGILWRANKEHIDPDYPYSIPAVRTVSFGLKADL
ncbi:SusC/RagA family TonB-linked outer membrane protein [Mucilaginibacter sp. HC2]|uniref:SusC/RagA family TonB-linked outer membrane protein n=1 Tax=Mucilaginibacter TaxID=423349 RepID=UPI000DCBF5CF|nr:MULTISPECIES: SusC/RagA family TonB-linked outer membrane protein [Mucilaginibacter]NHA05520.1 SusC/RagA family TonB-linked outer membrane protein [Mucilaginibacter inviolabilis]QTE35328.1 SusC/RagA family TonB-linked outer membrane protein [Mucilaginibacter gossypii]RAV59469.1 SusC/RagA family TonB-linked outer membrane protein [Mucilaginibacter rubeus]